MAKVRGVIFDMDGVLIDARDWHYLALNEALAPFGYDISREEHLQRFDGLTTRSKLQILSDELGLPKNLHQLIGKVKQDRTLRLAASKCYPNIAHLILLERLRSKDIRLGLYTNSIRETSEYMLRHAGILNFFEVFISNEDVTSPKPNPEGYLKACAELSLDPSEVLVIEDGEYGVLAARKAGCKVHQVSAPQDVNIEALSPYIEGLV
jgi:HAD superfamily hydrolase (TIGR01509 family)